MFCKKCLKEVEPQYEQVGVHIAKFCPHCGTFDKFVSKEEAEGKPLKKKAESKPLF